MAAVAQHCHSWNKDMAVVVRFANASANSWSLEQTLNSMVVQLDLVDTGKSTWFKHVRFVFYYFINFLLLFYFLSLYIYIVFQDVQSYSEQIKRLLSSIGAKRPVTLIVDGIDRVKKPITTSCSTFSYRL